eukprot:TRINITY_DN2189_c0_g1_i1.p1 TRINITY_DN2189_c0_g1~~TRINITY_DN2189_c0_g1_i1.p1  ORF type:complete len:120 (+),score=33.02 TRINITY_DN2189_c0_g1_i1:125-484(+)
MSSDTSFLGYSVPVEVKRCLPILNKIKDLQKIELVADFVLAYLAGGDFTEEMFNQICVDLDFERKICSTLFTGLYYVLRHAIRNRVKSNGFKMGLEELKVPNKTINQIWKAYLKRLLFS